VTVPDVTNQTQANASSALTSAGLTLGAISTTSSMTVPAGSVIAQNPAAGADVVVASAVALVISSGLPHVSAPALVGLTQAAASTAITSAQLVVGIISHASSMTVPAGTVISQSPAAGADVVVGSAIALIVSTGLPHVSAPDVIGLTETAASTTITGVQLVVGTITTAASTIVPAGSVISQSPTAGSDVVVGSAIALTISTGLPHVAVPDTVNQTQAAAIDILTGAGLTALGLSDRSTAVELIVGGANQPPTGVIFQASADHAIVSSYRVEIFAAGVAPATGVPLASADVGKPTPDANNDITVAMPAFFEPLTPGTYQVTVSSVGAFATAPSMTVPAGSVVEQSPS
jgi:beta-lactam-binding protein with PASTA domain